MLYLMKVKMNLTRDLETAFHISQMNSNLILINKMVERVFKINKTKELFLSCFQVNRVMFIEAQCYKK